MANEFSGYCYFCDKKLPSNRHGLKSDLMDGRFCSKKCRSLAEQEECGRDCT